jgi:hypothetical protein
MTVPHGLRPSWEREQHRRDLVEQAVGAIDLDADREILEGVAREEWWAFHQQAIDRIGIPIVLE